MPLNLILRSIYTLIKNITTSFHICIILNREAVRPCSRRWLSSDICHVVLLRRVHRELKLIRYLAWQPQCADQVMNDMLFVFRHTHMFPSQLEFGKGRKVITFGRPPLRSFTVYPSTARLFDVAANGSGHVKLND